MPSDSQLRSDLRAALDAVSPPAPWLSHRVEQRLRASISVGTKRRARQRLRIGLNVVAILVLIAVGIAAAGVFLAIHQPVAPAHPGAGSVVVPNITMVSPTTGWSASDQVILRTTDGRPDLD